MRSTRGLLGGVTTSGAGGAEGCSGVMTGGSGAGVVSGVGVGVGVGVGSGVASGVGVAVGVGVGSPGSAVGVGVGSWLRASCERARGLARVIAAAATAKVLLISKA